MEAVQEFVREHPYTVTVGLALPVALFLIRRKLRSKPKRPDCPPDTVLLFQIGRGPYAPSISPFPLKLETYLRMAKIHYVNDQSGQFSSKRKTPWMIYNGEEVPDSQFCIEYLNKKRNIDLNKSLSTSDRAVAKAFQVLVDEHLYWPMVYFRWIYDQEKKLLSLVIPYVFRQWVAPRMVKPQLHGQGIGRHTTEEIKHILMTDLQVLADFLGNKSFLMGAIPTEVDCSAFGMLAQLVWHDSNDVCKNLVQDKFPSLYQYCFRMKERFWPDWDSCITHGATRKATS